jgi:PAS domain S-box-containing protein
MRIAGPAAASPPEKSRIRLLAWDVPWQSKRGAGKQRGVLFSFVGILFGLLVTLAFVKSGFWRVDLEVWSWFVAATCLYHLGLWLIPQLGWDARLSWDPNYLYVPWACLVVFLSLTVYFMPDARSLIPFAFLVSLLYQVGIAGFRDVLGGSMALWTGYLTAVFLLVRRGEPISLPYEASQAGLFFGLSLLAGMVLNRARRHRWELAGLRRRLTLAIRGSGGGWWDLVLDPSQPTAVPDSVHLSTELKALIGFEDHEFPNSLKAWHSRIVDANSDQILESCQRVLAGTSQLRETRYRIRHSTGEVREIYSHSSIQRNSAGRPVRWSGLEWDVTERERAQQELRKLSRAVEQSPSLVIITDTAGIIEYVNPKFCRTTGYSLAEVVGKNPKILRSGETPDESYHELWRTIGEGGEWRGEFKNRRKNGEPYLVISSISPIKDATGEITHFLAVQEDVTERRQVEAQLHQAQRMESVGQLVSGVAHDFNNLLTAVIGFAELGLASVGEDDPVSEHLTQIRQAGESAGDLTRKLLAFGRRQILRFEVLDINDKVRSVQRLLHRTIGENMELVTRLAPDLRHVKADPMSIEQVLVNLAVNARDAMPHGGRLTIQTANVDLELTTDHALLEPGSYILLSVIDTGKGMDGETRSRAFEPFFTTKERGRGTGLGLSSVYGIVKQSDGHIDITSEVGSGTRFDIYLPATSEEPRRVTTDGALESPEVGLEAILLVEDDQRVRDLVARMLDARGYRVVQASNAVEALEVLEAETCNLLLTDVVMPGMSGIELADVACSKRPDLKVLFMSGYADQETTGDEVDRLDAPFIGKPFRIDELLRKVRAVLESGQPRRNGGSFRADMLSLP